MLSKHPSPTQFNGRRHLSEFAPCSCTTYQRSVHRLALQNMDLGVHWRKRMCTDVLLNYYFEQIFHVPFCDVFMNYWTIVSNKYFMFRFATCGETTTLEAHDEWWCMYEIFVQICLLTLTVLSVPFYIPSAIVYRFFHMRFQRGRSNQS